MPSSAAQLHDIVHGRVADGRSTGIVAGVLQPDGEIVVVAHGDAGDGRALEADAILEIGSITKLFTATLLADMVLRAELALDDPVAGLLPSHVRVPSRGDRRITLADLATHASGLPRMPPVIGDAGPVDSFAGFSANDLYAFLATCELDRDPGSRVEYSNLGFGLLGHALALRAGTGFEELVTRRILRPLGMTSSAFALGEDLRSRAAAGHDPHGAHAPPVGLGQLGAAGALRSSAGDMLRFAAACMDGAGGPLRDAIAAAQAPRRRIALATRIGLAWFVLGSRDRRILFHDGGTAGFASSLALRPARRTAAIVLSNSSRSTVNDIGLHLVQPRLRLRPAPRPRTAIALAPEILDRYAGSYELAGSTVRLKRCEDGLEVHVPGATVDTLYPESERRFFLATTDTQVTFRRDLRGNVSGARVVTEGRRLAVRKLA